MLLHTLPDGSSHYDWLIELPGRTDEHRLRSFRTDSNPSQWYSGQLFHGEQLPDHRAHYLTYEGPIGADRGSVERISIGLCQETQLDSDSELSLSVFWQLPGDRYGEIVRYSGQKTAGRFWELGC